MAEGLTSKIEAWTKTCLGSEWNAVPQGTFYWDLRKEDEVCDSSLLFFAFYQRHHIFFYPWGTRDHLFQGKFNASHIWTQILSSWPSITFHYSILMKTRDFVNFAQSHWCECVCIKRKLQTFLKIKLLELCQHWHFTVSSILFFFFPINTLKFNVPEFDTIQINASESSTSGFNNNSNNFQYLFS